MVFPDGVGNHVHLLILATHVVSGEHGFELLDPEFLSDWIDDEMAVGHLEVSGSLQVHLESALISILALVLVVGFLRLEPEPYHISVSLGFLRDIE